MANSSFAFRDFVDFFPKYFWSRVGWIRRSETMDMEDWLYIYIFHHKISIPMEKRRETRAHCLLHVKTEWECCPLLDRKWALSGERNWLAPWSWTPQPRELLEINFCCSSHPVYGILLWQPQLSKTNTKMIILWLLLLL